jgi:hypothetical protein
MQKKLPLLLLVCVIAFSSCGPKRYGCGPRRCEVKVKPTNELQQLGKNISLIS